MSNIPAEIKELVEHMLSLHKKLTAAKISADKLKIKQQIADADKQITALVYKLYDLTDEEIELIKDK
ncbi:MAG: hypothetical protein JW787_16655 [Sedimentisphaerales bacterium]|nr:hypothetical protein [Sedimentisphaerales bacterium]